MYGAEAGNLALKGLALGGVYLGGGIAPRLQPFFTDGRFMRAFADKGRLEPFVSTLPDDTWRRMGQVLLAGEFEKAAEIAAAMGLF